MIDKKIEQEFFDNLEENLSKADIAFKAYESGYADAIAIEQQNLGHCKECKYFDEQDSRKYLNEFEKLEDYLIDNDYVYERIDKVNSSIKDEERDYHQLIAYTKKSDDVFDVVISKSLHSYGYEKGLLELSGCLVKSKDDNVEGFLTADDIIKRLEEQNEI